MAGGAAAGAVIARAVVRAEEVEQRIVEAGLVGADDDGIDPREGAEAALAEAAEWPARWLEGIRVADFCEAGAAFFKNAEQVAGLRDVEAWQREDGLHDPHFFLHFRRDLDRAL